MVLATAAWHAAASVAQPQRAADRRGNGSPRATDIQDLARFAGRDVHARTVAGEHAGNVEWDRCTVAQESAHATWAMLELLWRSHHDQFIAGAECAKLIVPKVCLRDTDHCIGPLGFEYGRISFLTGRFRGSA